MYFQKKTSKFYILIINDHLFLAFWQINVILETYHWNESWRKEDRQRGKIKTKKEAGKEKNYKNELKTLWFTSQQF